MKAVILAGGLGTRLSEVTSRIPKPMVEIGGRPILWHIMKTYSEHGVNEFVICLGYKGYVIKEFFMNYFHHMSDVTVNVATGEIEVLKKKAEPWKITLVDTGLNTLTAGRISRVADYLDDDEPFCLTYGDGVGDINVKELIEFHKAHSCAATVTAVSPPGRFGLLDIKGSEVRGFQEKPEDNTGWINGGFFVLEKTILKYINGDDVMFERGPLETIAKDGNLQSYKHEGFWQPMDTLRDKNDLEELWESGKAPWKIW